MTANNSPFVEVITAEALASRTENWASQLTEDYRDRQPVFVGVLPRFARRFSAIGPGSQTRLWMWISWP